MAPYDLRAASASLMVITPLAITEVREVTVRGGRRPAVGTAALVTTRPLK